MNFVNNLKKLLKLTPEKPHQINKAFDIYDVGFSSLNGYSGEKSTQFDYKTAGNEAYKQSVWCYRCIREISNRVTSIRWGVYTKDGDGEKIEVENSPLGELLLYPNEYESFKEFIDAWVVFMNVTGNNYIYIGEKKAGKPYQLMNLRPDRIKIDASKDPLQPIRSYNYTIDSITTKIPPEEIIHFKFMDPTDDYYGLSPVYVAARILDTENYSTDWNKSMMRNSCRPNGVFTTDGISLQEESRTNLQNLIQTHFQGATNAFRPAIMGEGLKWEPMQLTPMDMDFSNLRKMSREEICAAFGVPPVTVGILDHATYSNFEQAEQTFWQQTVIPTLRKFRDLFNRRISVLFGDNIFIDYNLDHVQALKESEESLYKRAREGFQAGILTRNEARSLVGMEAIEGEDELYMPQNYIISGSTIEATQQQATQPASSPKCSHGFDVKQSQAKDPREKIVKVAAKEIQKILVKYIKETTKRLKVSETGDFTQAITSGYNDLKDDFRSFYTEFYKKIVKQYGQQAINEVLANAKKHDANYLFTKQDFELSPELIVWIENTTGERIVSVSESVLERIIDKVKGAVSEGLQNGDTLREITDKLMLLEEIDTFYQAQRIAWNETISASNAGSYFGVKQLPFGSQIKKEWLATKDDRTREAHLNANGQKKNMNEPFIVDGEPLNFPGDSSLGASAGNVIQCRCTIIYDTTNIGGLVNDNTII